MVQVGITPVACVLDRRGERHDNRQYYEEQLHSRYSCWNGVYESLKGGL